MCIRFFKYGFLILIFSSCGSDEKMTDGELVWRSGYPTNSLASTCPPILMDDMVIFANDVVGGNDLLVAYDKSNGEELWTIENNKISNPRNLSFVLDDQRLYIFSRGILFSISKQGIILWSKELTSSGGAQKVVEWNDVLYVYGETNNNSATIYRIDKANGSEEIAFNFSYSDATPNFRNVQFFEANGMTQLAVSLFLISENFQPAGDSTYCYNLVNSELLWKDDIVNGEIRNAMQKDAMVYFKSGDFQIAYDLANRHEDWRVELESSIAFQATFIHDNSLYYGEAEGSSANSVSKLVRRSRLNGTLELKSAEVFSYPLGGFKVYGTSVFVTRGRDLLELSLDDFERLNSNRSPDYGLNNNAFFDRNISIDPNTGDIYIGNFVAAMKYRQRD